MESNDKIILEILEGKENKENYEKFSEGTTVFINTTTPPESIFDLINKGYKVVLPNTIDVGEFLDNPGLVEAGVINGDIVFHAWAPEALKQWDKPEGSPMYSSAYKREIPYKEILQNPAAVGLAEIIDRNAVPRDEWLAKDFEFPAFPEDLLAEIGCSSDLNRTEVFKKCDERIQNGDERATYIKDLYDLWYASRLASQHNCMLLSYDNRLLDVEKLKTRFARGNDKALNNGSEERRPGVNDFEGQVSPERAAEGSWPTIEEILREDTFLRG